MSTRFSLAICLLAGLFLLPGCIRRTITVTSDPEGALVYLNDHEVGRTPTSIPFTFYGTYDVRLEKDGYQTLQTSAEVKAPLKDQPGIDLITEAMPGTTHIDIPLHFEMAPAEPVAEADLIQRAQEMRANLKSDVESESEE